MKYSYHIEEIFKNDTIFTRKKFFNQMLFKIYQYINKI